MKSRLKVLECVEKEKLDPSGVTEEISSKFRGGE